MKGTSATCASEMNRCSSSSQIAFGYRIGVHADSANARDRAQHSGVHPDRDREPRSAATGRRDHAVSVVRTVGAHGDQPTPATRFRCGQSVGNDPGRARAELVPPLRSLVTAITGADAGVETMAINAFKPLTPVYLSPAPCLA